MKRILIVVANLELRHRLRGLYEHNGHVVECATNAIDAIRIGLVLEPHVVLTGWELDEETSGLRVAEALMKRLANPRVVFLTNKNPKVLAPQCEHLQAHEFLDERASPSALLQLTEA